MEQLENQMETLSLKPPSTWTKTHSDVNVVFSANRSTSLTTAATYAVECKSQILLLIMPVLNLADLMDM